MEYLEFKNTIINNLKELYGSKYSLKELSIIKNNDTVLDAISLRNGNEPLSPAIFINDLFTKYYLKGTTIDEIIDNIIMVYEDRRIKKDFDVNFLSDFELVRPHIAFMLINRDSNKHLLKDVPHIPYLDLAICFYCHLSTMNNNHASILIKNEHLEFWNITDEELYEIALYNTANLFPPKIEPMSAFTEKLIKHAHNNDPSSEFDIDIEIIRRMSEDILVLTNDSNYFGASVILYKNLLQEISELNNSSYFIIPSSIHEVIMIPDYDSTDKDQELQALNELVNSVNKECISIEDYLSDHAYYYDCTQKTLKCS